MNILFVTDDYPRNGSLDKSFIEGFQANGLKVKTVYPLFDTGFNDDTLRERLINRVRIELKLYEKSILKNLTKIDLKAFDFVFVFKGYNFNEEAFQLLKTKPIYCFNPDDPYNDSNSNKNIRSLISKYDAYFTYSKEILKTLQKNEKTPIFHVPLASDFSVFKKKLNKNKKFPISFIGNYDLERETYLKDLREINNLFIFGVNWKRKCKNMRLQPRFFEPKINSEFCETVQASIVNLNILRQQNKNSQNMRTFEIPACGGFVLHEFSEEVAEMFEEGRNIEFFRDVNEMNEKIEFYLKNPEKAEIVGENGWKNVSENNHTYAERVKKIIQIVNSN